MGYKKIKVVMTICAVLAVGISNTNCKDDNPPDNDINVQTQESIESASDLTICSFNIQFLGHFKKKDNKSLANLLKDYDIVVIQELVAPPKSGQYPNGDFYSADDEAKAFFDEMESQGFSYQLSEEDTGTNDEIHSKTSSTEWWVSFFKSEKIELANDLPFGFLDDDRSNNDDFERVPYAFAYRTVDSSTDFVLISVHLQPGSSSNNKARRKHEIRTISNWIDSHDDVEKDFIILGDMNIEDSLELADVTPVGYLSLNDECVITNTLLRNDGTGGKPYDHVMFNLTHTTEINQSFDFDVVDLVKEMESHWSSTDPYPGNPYNHNLFRQYYSDHHPVVFKLNVSQSDDD